MKKGLVERIGKGMSVALFAVAALSWLPSGCANRSALPDDPARIRPDAGPARRDMYRRPPADDHEATPHLAAESSIEEYFTYALERNEGLRAAHAAWAAAAERPRQARSLPDPRLSFETDDSFDMWEFGLMQTYPWWGKRALLGDAAESAALALYSRYRAEVLEVLSALRDAYGRYYYLHRSIEITEENLELMEYFEEVVRRRFETGAAAYADLVRVEVEAEQLRDRVQELRDQRRSRRAALNRVLGRPHNAPLPTPTTLPQEAVARLDEDQLFEIAREHNPRLLTLRHGIDRREDQAELAKKRYYPDITIGVMRREEQMGGMRADDEMNMAMLSMNLPLWRGSYGAGVREAQAEIDSQQRSLSDTEYAVESGLENALFSFGDARRRIELYEDYLLRKAEESLKASETAYRAGDVDVLNLLDAQRVLLHFELALERAKAERFEAIGKIENLAGIPVTETLRRILDRSDRSDLSDPSD